MSAPVPPELKPADCSIPWSASPQAGAAGCQDCRPCATIGPSGCRHDLVAGLVLTTMLVPVGIAYAQASGVPGHIRSVRHVDPAAGVRAVRSQPHPGARTGFFTGRFDPRRHIAACRKRSESRRGRGRPAGGGVRGVVHSCRSLAPGIHHRAAVEADPLRIHERHRTDRADQPTAQSCSESRSSPMARCTPSGTWHGRYMAGQHELDHLCHWRRRAGDHTSAKALPAHSGHFAGCRCRHDRRRRARPGRDRRSAGARRDAPGPAALRAAPDQPGGTGRDRDRRHRNRVSVVYRHQHSVAHLCREDPRPTWIRTRKWSVSAPPTLRRACFRAFRSAAAPRALRSPKPPAPRTQLTGVVGAVIGGGAADVSRRTCCGICPTARWPES